MIVNLQSHAKQIGRINSRRSVYYNFITDEYNRHKNSGHDAAEERAP